MDGKKIHICARASAHCGASPCAPISHQTQKGTKRISIGKSVRVKLQTWFFSLALLLQFLMDDVHCGWMSDDSSGHKAKTNQPVVYYSSIILKRRNGFSVNETVSSEWKLQRREAWNIAIMKFNYIFPPSVALCRVLQDILIVIHEKLIGTDHGKWRWKGGKSFLDCDFSLLELLRSTDRLLDWEVHKLWHVTREGLIGRVWQIDGWANLSLFLT